MGRRGETATPWKSFSTLAFVTQVLDPSDPLLGFVPTYLRPLSSRVDNLVVIASGFDRSRLISMRKWCLSEKRVATADNGVRTLSSHLARLALRPGPTVIVAHMCPSYLILAGPIGKVARMRMLLWFAGPWDTLQLRLAERIADAIVTTSPFSYPRNTAKVHAIGQAIDIEAFPYAFPSIMHVIRR